MGEAGTRLTVVDSRFERADEPSFAGGYARRSSSAADRNLECERCDFFDNESPGGCLVSLGDGNAKATIRDGSFLFQWGPRSFCRAV
ncbi:MAG: hypothetical protein R3F11_29570 [Verrucomicrobiales bacterium]